MTIKQYTLETLKDSKFSFTINDNSLDIRIYQSDIGLLYDLYVNNDIVLSGCYFYNDIVFYETNEYKLYFKNINKVNNDNIISYYDLYNYNLFVEINDD